MAKVSLVFILKKSKKNMKSEPAVLIIFYTRRGNTAKMAEAVAQGAKQEGATIKLMRIADDVPIDIVKKDQIWFEKHQELEKQYPTSDEFTIIEEMSKADAIIFGSPTRFGNMAHEMKKMWDLSTDLWFTGKLIGKVGGVFTGASSVHGGQETTALSMMFPMLHQGMIIVGPSYDTKELHESGSPYGPSTIVGANSDQIKEVDLVVARALGSKIAKITSKLSD
ncbi:MAG: NAD(P)H:quinone oxidoreductase [Nitrosopumilaceae archaeon]|nr:NAD(P)H:quinone oxidoreductase [Nitrosopumilaceae archaeon]NIP09980.1 NAD(P)H:quinone oxidoreductase [Nitrosopumilaceae archaeon]NIS94751.1 NAD(P)H:quinone oxidoreductase [Nitrosopumilaceae archaeon]